MGPPRVLDGDHFSRLRCQGQTSTLGMAKPGNATVTYRIKSISFRVRRAPGSPNPTSLTTPKAVAALARDLIADDGREHFLVLLLGSALNVIGYHEVGVGTADCVLSMPRDIFGAALRTPGCVGLIAVHNHPSGKVRPSRSDRVLTRCLIKASKLLLVALHDHVIFSHGNGDYYSFDDHRKGP